MLFQHRGQPNTLAITIDDGPHPDVTPAILDVLAKHEAFATFYVIGNRLSRHPEIAQRIVDEGHLIANHTYTHPTAPRSMDEIPRDRREWQIDQATHAIVSTTGITPCHYRSPQGRSRTELTQQLAFERGMSVAHWSLNFRDTLQPRFFDEDWITETVAAVTQDVPDRPILLLHDRNTEHNTPEALDRTITIFKQRGYSFVDPVGNPIPPLDQSLKDTCPARHRVDARYRDLAPGETHRHGIFCATAFGIFAGQSEGEFSPNSPLTRGQAATVVERMINQLGIVITSDGGNRFTDTAGTTHSAAINRLASIGVVGGRPDGTFQPHTAITRAQFASMIHTALTELFDAQFEEDASLGDTRPSIFSQALADLSASAILSSKPNGTLRPNATVTRGQGASIVMRAYVHVVAGT